MNRGNVERIIDDLRCNWSRCGLVEGDVVLVHSSLKKLLNLLKERYKEAVTPEIVYASLMSTLGSEGTLLLPLFNFEFTSKGYFNIYETPSQMGVLTEIGRMKKDSVRTGHPVYSFSVVGKLSYLFKGIDNVSGYGSDSPFSKLHEMNGKVAVIGLTDRNSMTSYHYVEERNLVEYRYFKDFTGTYIDANHVKKIKTYKLFVRDLQKGVRADMNRMMDYLWSIGAYKGDRHDEGYGMRTIEFKDLYCETDRIIKSGRAIDYLYSLDR